MVVRLKVRSLARCGLWLVVCVALAGCSWADPGPQVVDEELLLPPAPPEPVLASSGDAQLTLFGEFPDRTRIPFQARAASPMEQHTFVAEGADFDVDVSPDGEWIVFSSTRHTLRPNLYLKTIHGRAVTQLTSDPAADVQPAFSPDGKWVAFASDRSGNWDLWMIGVDGGQPTQVTRSLLHEVHPSFSPDGKRLVYCVFNPKAAQWELWTVELARSEARKMIGVGLFPRWSPVGDSIVYQKARQRGGRWFSVWRLDLEGGEPKFPIELAVSAEMALIQPTWSPDGEWVAYGTARLGGVGEAGDAAGSPVSSRGEIWIVRSDGSSPVCLTDGQGSSFGPAWSRDGRVYCTSLQNGVENIWSVKPTLVPISAGSTAEHGGPAGGSGWGASRPPVATGNQGG